MGVLASTHLSATFREAVSKHKDQRMKDETSGSVAYSTGFLNFDFMNGTVVHVKDENRDFKYYSYGIQDGCLVMLIGRSGCGKTTFAMQTAANIVRNYPTAVLFHDDIEGGLSPDRLVTLTKFTPEQIEAKYIGRNAGVTAENFYERIKMIHDLKLANREEYMYDTKAFDYSGKRIFKYEPTVYVLDSLSMLMPEKYTEEEQLSGSMSATAAAKTNSMSFRRIIPMLKAANIILLMINHINQKVEINPMMHSKTQVGYLKQGETLPGGNTTIYLSNLLLRFDDGTKLKPDEAFGIAGTMVDITLVKSRNNRAGKSCTMVFDQTTGFDPELSLFVMLKNEKRIGGAGAYLYINGLPEVKFNQKNFKQKLYENAELRQAFINEALYVLKTDLEAEYERKANTISTDSLMVMDEMLSQINPNL